MNIQTMLIAGVLVAIAAAGMIYILSDFSNTYSLNVGNDTRSLSAISNVYNDTADDITTIQEELSNVKQVNLAGVIFGLPDAVIASIKLVLIDVPSLFHTIITELFVVLQLPTELVYGLYLIAVIVVIFAVISIWTGSGFANG